MRDYEYPLHRVAWEDMPLRWIPQVRAQSQGFGGAGLRILLKRNPERCIYSSSVLTTLRLVGNRRTRC
jgi:hypothetical protein